ncbi:helical backbone metal receptor [Marivirga sp.]|uniref:ABC transporter substrate-binding protein n=1 Tax=Marivirga sp. TaxID=2018662 RepID=UPI002D80E107|nr:helical backbone metal receptor [Marivirga sp.]HET8861540.1 helical backbone metal receptor [Marivirga sp.]
MLKLKDQIDNVVELEKSASRIVCLVPSITEFLYDLGLEDKVLGITKFCVHPQHWLKEKQIVGGTKQQHIDKIRALKPDLIIASKEENVKHYVEKLCKISPVYVSDVNDFDSALGMMNDIALLTNNADTAKKLNHDIVNKFNHIDKPIVNIKIAYCIWKNPWMWAGTDTYISNMLSHCGFENTLKQNRYPEMEMLDVIKESPDFIFLSSEPFPFQSKHIDELKTEFPKTRFMIVDGEMFSWYGSRMLKAPEYFNSLLGQLKSK